MKLFQIIIAFFKKLFGIEEKVEETTAEPEISGGDTQIDKPEWIVENQINDAESNCLKVVYREKYGAEIITYCMVLFRNDKTKQYKMVAPWLKSKIVEMSNITGIEVYEVSKSEASI